MDNFFNIERKHCPKVYDFPTVYNNNNVPWKLLNTAGKKKKKRKPSKHKSISLKQLSNHNKYYPYPCMAMQEREREQTIIK